MTDIFTLQNLPDLAIGLLLVVAGVTVGLGQRRSRVNLAFAAFLVLLGAGFVTDALYLAEEQRIGDAATPQPTRLLMNLGGLDVALGALNPVALVVFAEAFSGRRRRVPVSLLAAGLALVVVLVEALTPVSIPAHPGPGARYGPFASRFGDLALTLVGLAEYAYAYWEVGRVWSADPPSLVGRQARLILVGLGVALFARFGLLTESFGEANAAFLAVGGDRAGLLLHRATQVALALAALGLAWWAVRGPREERARLMRETALVMLAFCALVWLVVPLLMLVGYVGPGYFGESLRTPMGFALQSLERSRYSGRWLVFAAYVGYAILRYQFFDLDARAQRAGLRAAAYLATAGAGIFLLVLVYAASPSLLNENPLASTALAFALALAGFMVIAALERRLDRLPRAAGAGQARREEVYQAALERAIRLDDRVDEAQLAASLGIEPARRQELRGSIERATGLRPGVTVAGRYRIVQLLGRGAGSRVFQARDRVLGRDVALKAYDASEGPEETSEARLAGSIRHANVVTVHDLVAYAGRPCLVMELAGGGSLADRLRARGPLAGEEAARCFGEMLAGLAAVHERGVVHGDLKPANVLFGERGQAMLSDFGSARLAESRTRGSDAEPFAFTPRYAAPEVLGGAAPTPRSDLYALGAVVAEALGGDPAATYAERVRGSALPPAAARVVEACLRLDARERPASARAALDALDAGGQPRHE